ncbi:MAG: restriction endonuclease subunit S [Flavobacteriales bacterium]
MSQASDPHTVALAKKEEEPAPLDEVRNGYQKTKLGWTPKDWEVVELKEISEKITKGSTPTTYGFSWQENGVLFLRNESIKDHGLYLEPAMRISEKAHDHMRRSKIRKGDILVTITGDVGRVVKYELDEEANVNQHIAKVRIVKEGFDPDYIKHYLSRWEVKKEYLKITTGQAYPQISLKQVQDTKVAAPPLPQQRRIADILATWDRAIEQTERLIEKKEELKKGLIEELMTGKKRLPGFSWEWKKWKIRQLSGYEKITITPSKQPREVFAYYSIPAYMEKEQPFYINGDEIKSEKLIINEDVILFGKLNPRVWKVWFVGEARSNKMIASTEFVPVEIPNYIDRRFIYYKLKTKIIKSLVRNMVSGSTGSHQRISREDFLSLKVDYPPFEERSEIVKILDDIHKEVSDLKRELFLIKEEKTALLKNLLNN